MGAQRTERLVELFVQRIGAQGDGVARYRGEPVFLPFTVPGDHVKARLGARRGGGWEGRVVEQLSSGDGRADPPCLHFGVCGGCLLQHLDSPTYREVKLGALRSALERVGINSAVVRPMRVVPPARRRVKLGLMRPRDPRLPSRVGFRQRYRHDLVDLTECLVMEAPLFATVGTLRRVAAHLLSPGGAAQATITRTDSGIDVLIEAAQRPALDALEALGRMAEESDLARIVWQSPGEETVVVQRRPVRVVLSGVSVGYPPAAFLQASEAAEAVLVEEVLSGLGPGRPALDLFAGLGTFAFALARSGPVHAVEGEGRTVAALAHAVSEVAGVTVEQRDLARDPVLPDRLGRCAGAVFDPPRAGAARQAEALGASTLERIVAVSCNPATFARDAAKLIAGGFRLERVTPIDQFVWTPHLELAAVFRR